MSVVATPPIRNQGNDSAHQALRQSKALNLLQAGAHEQRGHRSRTFARWKLFQGPLKTTQLDQ